MPARQMIIVAALMSLPTGVWGCFDDPPLQRPTDTAATDASINVDSAAPEDADAEDALPADAGPGDTADATSDDTDIIADDDDAAAPELCGEDERVQAGACQSCLPGRFNAAGDDPDNLTAQDTTCAPKTCGAGEHVAGYVCVPCSDGLFRDSGDLTDGGNTLCVAALCAVNQHVVDYACVDCSDGALNTAGDSTAAGSTVCDAQLCAEDQHVSGGACVFCPLGTFRDAGDSPIQSDTACSAETCGADQRVLAYQCVACEGGTFSPGGDKTTAGATPCAPRFCGADEYVDTFACASCAAGTSNAAGNSTAGGDTSCQAVLCGPDEYVSDNACIQCAEGDVNAGGDDASADNTLCDDFCTQMIGLNCPAFSEAYVKPSGISVPDGSFGRLVAISGDRMAVVGTAPCTTETMACCGQAGCENGDAVFIYQRNWSDDQATWTGVDLVRPLEQEPGDFISALALRGDLLALGMAGEDSCQAGTAGVGGVGFLLGDNDCEDTGAVYVFGFDSSDSDWKIEAYLKEAALTLDAKFGGSLSLDGDRLAVGQSLPLFSDGATRAVHLFQRRMIGGVVPTWEVDGIVAASNGGSYDWFGRAIALRGSILAVGAPYEDSCDSSDLASNACSSMGAVYLYRRSADLGSWEQAAVIKSSPTDPTYQLFGSRLDWAGEELVVSSFQETRVFGLVAGQASAFMPVEKASLGKGVLLSGQLAAGPFTIALGDPTGRYCGRDLGPFTPATSTATCWGSGQVRVYKAQDDGSWAEFAWIKTSNPEPPVEPPIWGGPTSLDQFGYAVALGGETLIIGAPREDSCAIGVNGDQDSNDCKDSGAVYVRRLAP